MFERCPQSHRRQIPDTRLPIRPPRDDHPRPAARALQIQKLHRLDALPLLVPLQRADHLALRQIHDADAAVDAADDRQRREGVDGERGDAAEIEAPVVGGELEFGGGGAGIPDDEGSVRAGCYYSFA